jgi:general nucleoside transport system permease protein
MTALDLPQAANARLRAALSSVGLVLAALFTALAVAALIMICSGVSLPTVGVALSSLALGAFGSPQAISETLVAATPLIIAGLGFIVGAKAGLFNVGVEGQILIGGMAGVIAGFSFTGLPMPVHLTLSLLAAFVGGAAYAGIAGWLRVSAGAHEVITTIMLNFIALRLVDFLLRNPPVQNPERSDPVSRFVAETAMLPRLFTWFDPSMRVNFGFILAVICAAFVAWLLWRTRWGFEIRVIGAAPKAGQFAGIVSNRVIVLAMMISGGIAGLAGASLTQGVLGRASPDFAAGLGFEAIAVALLARSHPVGVVFSGIIFGALTAGGRRMQVTAGVSLDLITIVQALVLLCIAAPILIRTLYPMLFRQSKEG